MLLIAPYRDRLKECKGIYEMVVYHTAGYNAHSMNLENAYVSFYTIIKSNPHVCNTH